MWLWGSTTVSTSFMSFEGDINTTKKKKKSNWLYKYAHGACSYFEGQVSKLSCKFCFTYYSLQITLSCSPVNTSFSFKNKAFKFLTCREKLQTWMIQREYKEKKKKCCFLNSLSTAILIWRYGVPKAIPHPTVASRRCLESRENRARVSNAFL